MSRKRPVASFTVDKAVLEQAKRKAEAARLPFSRWLEIVVARAVEQ